MMRYRSIIAGNFFTAILFVACLLLCECQANAYQQLAIRYQSPVPGAIYVSSSTNIILRVSDMLDETSVSVPSLLIVRGMESGDHKGSIVIADDRSTILFKPHQPFTPGEEVVVTLSRSIRSVKGYELKPFVFSFHISATTKLRLDKETFDNEFLCAHSLDFSGHSYPMLSILSDTLPPDFPHIQSSVLGTPSTGKIFLSNFVFSGSITTYLMILENSGAPIFYRKMQSACLDFKVQPNKLFTYFDVTTNTFYGMDSLFVIVDSFAMGNAYPTDEHELQILPDGHALMMAYDPQIVDMSSIVSHGHDSATVLGLIIQEIDNNKNVVFQWRSWDHFQITDATHEDLTAARIDYVHGNALEPDHDGNILLSSRHMDEITKIDRKTGEIIWRLGGKHNQFSFVNDSIGFSHQHAIRRLENGNITLYDNGYAHSPPFSRAVEYQLDEQVKTATLVWQYRNTPDIYGFAMGNVQRLENGNTLISWGATNPTATEVEPNGAKVYEMSFDSSIFSYRAFRFPWKETPTGVRSDLPRKFQLLQNYPNPFNNNTEIVFDLSEETIVSLKVYNVLGSFVATLMEGQRRTPGVQRILFDGSSLSSGVYYYRVFAGHEGYTRRMLLIK